MSTLQGKKIRLETQILNSGEQLDIFCEKCKSLGYQNNQSLHAMKFDWVLENGGIWHCVLNEKQEIVSLAGCHPLPEVNNNAWRVQFRGVQLPQDYGTGLSKYFMSSLIWRLILPYQLEFLAKEYNNTNEIYVSTTKIDNSGLMARIHKMFFILEKLNLVEKYADMNLFFTDQTVWKLNTKKYLEVRSNLNN